MRSMIVGLICLLPTAALAYDLPVSEDGNYCGNALGLGGVTIDHWGISAANWECRASSPITGAMVEVTCAPSWRNKGPNQPFKMDVILIENTHTGLDSGPTLKIADADKGGAWVIGVCD